MGNGIQHDPTHRTCRYKVNFAAKKQDGTSQNDFISALATGYPLTGSTLRKHGNKSELLRHIVCDKAAIVMDHWIVYGGRNALLGHTIARASYIIRMLCCMYGC